MEKKNTIFRKPANYYEDQPPIPISHIPIVDLAFISNSSDNLPEVTYYIFDKIHLSYADFKICFFDSVLENFNISPANFEVQALSLHQNYIDTTKINQPFQLNNAVLYAWAEKNQSTIAAIPIYTKIILNKSTLLIRSIGSFLDVQNALSWNEAIQTLIESGEIIPAKKDKLACAIIDFNIYVQYNYTPLEVAVNMQFSYRIHVPGYKNRPEPNPCYSKDISLPRKVFQFSNYNNSNIDKIDSINPTFDEHPLSEEGSDSGSENLPRETEYNFNQPSDDNSLQDSVSMVTGYLTESVAGVETAGPW